MKKVKFLLVSLISIFAFNINVFAASGSLGVSSASVYVGDSFTVTANVNSAAAWNIHVSASGPVNGCSINQADATADAMDTNKTFSATCTAIATGTITIKLSGDVTSAEDGNAVNISDSKSVTVSAKPAPPSNNNSNNNSSSSNGNNNSNNSASNNNQTVDNRSKNNNIKELTIEGYELTKVDNNNYTLSVPNDVTSVNIKATAEDTKAKVTGIGDHDLSVGENNIEVIVTAENGSQNKINIKVTRKDGYYLEDLDSVLNNNKLNDINIIINSDTIINSQNLEKIKNSNKNVKFSYYDENKSLLYSWIIDGSKLRDTNDFSTTISYNSENKKDMLRLSNYVDGLFMGFKQIDNLSNGVKIKLYVGDKYNNDDLVNVYSYIKNSDKLNLIKKKTKVEDGYIEFDVVNASDYIVTMSTIPNLNEVTINSNESSSVVLLILISIIVLVVIVTVIVFVLKKKKEKDDVTIEKDTSIIVDNNYENLDVDDSTIVSNYDNYNVNNNYSSYDNHNNVEYDSNEDNDNKSISFKNDNDESSFN